MEIKIRLGRVEDLPVLRQILQSPGENVCPQLVFSSSKDLELADRLSSPRGRFFVLEVDTRLAGFAQLEQKDGRLWELCRLYVIPGCRGQGLGSRLLEKCRQILGQEGLLVVSVEKDNHRGLHFYLNHGFSYKDAAQNSNFFLLERNFRKLVET
ncbi:MAG: GNAT family N-acetyltransferase [Clostridia bacterium]|nr:GNAT family N-acetyltransferase [Clostridia bacterium]